MSDIEVLINDLPLFVDFEVHLRPVELPEMAEMQLARIEYDEGEEYRCHNFIPERNLQNNHPK